MDADLMDTVPLFKSRDFSSALWTRTSSDVNFTLWGVGAEGTAALLPGEGENKAVERRPDWGRWGQFRATRAPWARGGAGAGGEKFPPQPNPPQGLTMAGAAPPKPRAGKSALRDLLGRNPK